MDMKPAKLLRYAKPRSYWLSGMADAAYEAIDDGVGELAFVTTFKVGIAGVLLMLDFVVETVWHPLFYLYPICVTVYVAYMLSFDVYERAERRDEKIHLEAIDKVSEDASFMGRGTSILFPSKEHLLRYKAVMDVEGGCDPLVRRNMAMRLAALLTDHRETTDPDDREAMADTAIAAQALVTEALRTMPYETRPPAPAEIVKRPARMIDAIVGNAARPDNTKSKRTADERADALIAIAEEALAAEPDLADAGGARIDILVRKHLPDLVASRDAALRHADPDEMAAARNLYEKGLERIRESVEEALDASQRAHSDQLADQVRFLGMRRGRIEADETGAETDGAGAGAGAGPAARKPRIFGGMFGKGGM